MIPENTMHPQVVPHEGLPDRIWVGKREGEWPLFLFDTEKYAQEWQAATDTARVRRIWEITTTGSSRERIVVPPTPPAPMWRDEQAVPEGGEA